MGSERPDPRGWDHLRAALGAGDPYDEVADCWAAKEKIRSVFKTRNPGQTQPVARIRNRHPSFVA